MAVISCKSPESHCGEGLVLSHIHKSKVELLSLFVLILKNSSWRSRTSCSRGLVNLRTFSVREELEYVEYWCHTVQLMRLWVIGLSDMYHRRHASPPMWIFMPWTVEKWSVNTCWESTTVMTCQINLLDSMLTYQSFYKWLRQSNFDVEAIPSGWWSPKLTLYHATLYKALTCR